MKQYITIIRASIWEDLYNRYFVLGSILLGVVEYIIWINVIVANDVFVYTRLTYYPIQLLLVIFILHLVLSIYSFSNDSHISHLLLGVIPFYAVFIFILEMFYIFGAH